MPSRTLQLKRPALFRERELRLIEQSALRILDEVGIDISHPELAERARRRGFQFHGDRVRLPNQQVSAFIDETRRGRGSHRAYRVPTGTEPVRLSLGISGYPQHVHDPESGEVVPFTSARLVEATKLVAMLGERGVSPAVPGCPVDVPPPLQPLLQYRIAIENLPGGVGPVDAKHVESLPYIMEMAEAVGQQIRSLPVYVFSPLRLGGESLTAVMAFETRLTSVTVGAMPAAGCTAPVRPAEGFALAAAEVIGSALILRECLPVEVGWGISLYPFDLRGMAMSFGSPESLLLQAASSEVDAYFRGTDWWQAVGNIHTLAKEPGPQAAAEKMSVMLAGALWGGRHFDSAGSLSLDELFSPVQLLVDTEVKDHVERLIRGLDTGCDVEACLKDVGDGSEHGFVGLERTLDRYQELYWHPRLFERRFLGPWLSAGSPSFTDRARETAAGLVSQHTFELAPDLRAELDRIYQTAERELGVR